MSYDWTKHDNIVSVNKIIEVRPSLSSTLWSKASSSNACNSLDRNTVYADNMQAKTPTKAMPGSCNCRIGFTPVRTQFVFERITPYIAALPDAASTTLSGRFPDARVTTPRLR